MRGMFFKSLVGKDPSSMESIADVERSVEAVIGKKLQVRFYQSELITPRGSIFPIGLKTDVDIEGSFFNL